MLSITSVITNIIACHLIEKNKMFHENKPSLDSCAITQTTDACLRKILYTKTEQEDTCVFSGFFVVFNEVIDNWGWYNIAYVLCIFMLKRLKSYTNAFTLVIKSRPP